MNLNFAEGKHDMISCMHNDDSVGVYGCGRDLEPNISKTDRGSIAKRPPIGNGQLRIEWSRDR